MKSSRVLSPLLTAASALFCVISVVFQVLGATTEFREDMLYFEAGSVFPYLAIGSVVLGILCGLLSAVFFRDKDFLPEKARRYVFIPAMVGSVAAFVLSLVFSDRPHPVCIVLIAVAFLSFLFMFLPLNRILSPVSAVLGFVAIASFAAFSIWLYVERGTEINSPVKNALQIALLTAMLYQTAEIRLLLRIPCARIFLFVSSFFLNASMLCLALIPTLAIKGLFSRPPFLIGTVFVTGMVITALLRTIFFYFDWFKPQNEPQEVPNEPQEVQNDPQKE